MTITRAMKHGIVAKTVLTTPGIVTQIATQLLCLNDTQENRAYGNEGVVNLYFSMNNDQLRYELVPFMEDIRLTVIKNRLIKNTHQYIEDVSNAKNSIKKAELVLRLFKYLCDCGDDKYLLGKTFAYTIGNQLDIIINQAYDNPKISHIVHKLKGYKQDLYHFTSWGEDKQNDN